MNLSSLISRLRDASATDHPFSSYDSVAEIGQEIADFLHATADFLEAAQTIGEDAVPMTSALLVMLGETVERTAAPVDPLAELLAMFGVTDEDVAAATASGHTFDGNCPACEALDAAVEVETVPSALDERE